MIDCVHFEGRTRAGRKLVHADNTEQQIQLGLRLEPEELMAWTRAPLSSEALLEEAAVFLLLRHRATGSTLLVEALAAALDQRMRLRAIECSGNIVGPHARELCADVVSLAWIILLESPGGRGVWLQICFRRFIQNLTRDVLRGIRLGEAMLLDSDSEAAPEVMDQSASPEDLIYVREVLSQLKPHQRQAFIMQRGFREPQCVIAKTLGRSDRSVRTWLKQAQRQLNARS